MHRSQSSTARHARARGADQPEPLAGPGGVIVQCPPLYQEWIDLLADIIVQELTTEGSA